MFFRFCLKEHEVLCCFGESRGIVLKGCGTAKRWRALASKYQGHAKPIILQDTMVPL
jgi:hypothetical protein